MTYVPHNQSVFIAAYAGALAGMGANERNPTSPLPASYLEIIESAGAFAQRFDTVYSGSTMSAQIVAIQHLCHAAWAGRLPIAPTFFVPSAYVELCNALIALVNEFTLYFTSNAIPPTSDVLEMYYSSNWAVTDWYIDGTVGVDSNDGLTAATPIKTGVELQRRLGPYARWDHSVTIHVLANGMTDPLIVKGCFLSIDLHIDVIGVPTILAADTIGGYLPIDHTIPRAAQLTSTTVLDYTPFIGKRIRITSGTREGWTTWIAKANPDGAGLNVARIAPGAAIKTTGSLPITTYTPIAGDPYVIESLPGIPKITLDIDGEISLISTGDLWGKRTVYVSAVDCRQILLLGLSLQYYYKSFIVGCVTSVIGGEIFHARDIQLGVAAACCALPNYTSSIYLFNYPLLYSLILGQGASASVLQDSVNVYSNCLVQGASITIAAAGTKLDTIQIFDAPGSFGSIYIQGVHVTLKNVSGKGNNYGIVVWNGTHIIHNNVLNVVGTVSDCRLSSAVAINLTQLAFKQADDYAQKGTATLVAGTVTVTVPWYHNTTQKITATHNTFGGTPGILSIQKLSTTQFAITSSSALDASTVDWQISPLGRDISVVVYS